MCTPRCLLEIRNRSCLRAIPVLACCLQRFLSTMILANSKVDNFWLIKTSLTEKYFPDHREYNTKIARLTGQSMKPTTKTLYLPLSKKTPADPIFNCYVWNWNCYQRWWARSFAFYMWPAIVQSCARCNLGQSWKTLEKIVFKNQWNGLGDELYSVYSEING